MKLRAVIIDDEVSSISNVKIILDEFCPEVEVVGQACSVLEGASVIADKKPDFLFLDIQLAAGNAFQLIQRIEHLSPMPEVVFLTAYDEYAIRAIKHDAADYLLKPIDIEDVIGSIERVKTRLSKTGSTKLDSKTVFITVPSSLGAIQKPAHEIISFTANGAYSEIKFTDQSSILSTRNLKYWEDYLLGFDEFKRIHHSTILNMKFVESFVFAENRLLLRDGKSFDVSRRKKEDVKSYFNKDK